jgi:hypothetical protein
MTFLNPCGEKGNPVAIKADDHASNFASGLSDVSVSQISPSVPTMSMAEPSDPIPASELSYPEDA